MGVEYNWIGEGGPWELGKLKRDIGNEAGVDWSERIAHMRAVCETDPAAAVVESDHGHPHDGRWLMARFDILDDTPFDWQGALESWADIRFGERR